MTLQERKEYCEQRDLCFITLQPIDFGNFDECGIIWNDQVGDTVFVKRKFVQDGDMGKVKVNTVKRLASVAERFGISKRIATSFSKRIIE